MRALALLLFLAIWQAGSLLIGSPLILPGPAEVLLAFLRLLPQPEFRAALAGTFLRGTAAFLLSALLGLAAGYAAGRSRRLETLLAPWMAVVRSTPVLSVILLAIIWFQAERVPVFVAFLVGFPIIAGNVREGVRQIDPGLREMATLFRVSPRQQLVRLEIPSLLPWALTGFSTALGIIWKAVVAAEVLSMPMNALGARMNLARSQLETADVFAWTAAAVILATLTELLLHFLRKRSGYATP